MNYHNMTDADRGEIQHVIRHFPLMTELRRETRNWTLDWFDYALERIYHYGHQVAIRGPQPPDALAILREERRQELLRKDEAAVLTEQNTALRAQISKLETQLATANSQADKRAEEDATRSKDQFNKTIRFGIWTAILGAVIGGALAKLF